MRGSRRHSRGRRGGPPGPGSSRPAARRALRPQRSGRTRSPASGPSRGCGGRGHSGLPSRTGSCPCYDSSHWAPSPSGRPPAQSGCTGALRSARTCPLPRSTPRWSRTCRPARRSRTRRSARPAARRGSPPSPGPCRPGPSRRRAAAVGGRVAAATETRPRSSVPRTASLGRRSACASPYGGRGRASWPLARTSLWTKAGGRPDRSRCPLPRPSPAPCRASPRQPRSAHSPPPR